MSRLLLLLPVIALAACAAAPPQTPPRQAALTPKVGVVGLVRELQQREINISNWQSVVSGVIRNSDKDDEVNVVRRRYEVTVFYDAGEQGTVVVDDKPDLVPGQRVRVVGDRIEPLPR